MHDHERDRIVIRRLADKIADLERRLHNVETAPQLQRTSVTGGFTRWFSEQGVGSVRIGQFTIDDVALQVNNGIDEIGEIYIGTSAGAADVAVANPEGLEATSVLRILGGVMFAPLVSCAWQHDPSTTVDGNGRAQVSSGTYTRAWTSILPIGTGKINSSVIVQLGSGVTEAAARIRARPWTTGGSVQTVYEETGISGSVFLAGLPWTIPDSILTPAANPVGASALLEIEVRVTGGAGNVLVAPDSPVSNFV